MKNLTDEELVKLYKTGNQDAFTELYNRYKTLVKFHCRKFFWIGSEIEDITQEGMKGLFNAVQTYKEEVASFKTYASLCIKSSILTAIKKYNDNSTIKIGGNISIESIEGFSHLVSTPEELVIDKESDNEVLSKLYKDLSKREKEVLKLYLEGLNYTEIAKELGVEVKAVDNALVRAKNKIFKNFEV